MAAHTPKTAAVPPPAPAAPPIQTDRSRKPQFSLRSMMIAMTAFAIVAGLSTFVGIEIILSMVVGLGVMLIVPVVIGTLACYCRGRRRTFYAGAFVGAISPHILFFRDGVNSIGLSIVILLAQAIAIPACGLTALYTRRFLERRGWHLPSSDDAG